MKRLASFCALGVLLAACGSPPPAHAPDAPLEIAPLDAGATQKSTSRESRASALDLPTFVASAEAQSVTSAHAAGFLNVAALRSLRAAPKIRDMVQAQTKMDLFDDVDWVLWVGPSIQHDDEGALLVGVRPGADIKWGIERLMRGASGQSKHFDELDFDGIRGWRLPGRRIVLRVRDDRVVVVRESHAREAIAAFKKPLSLTPSPGEIAGLFGTGEGARFAGLTLAPGTDQFEEIHVSLEAKSDGAALHVIGRCPDPTAAIVVADRLSALLTQLKASARLVTNGLLDDASASASGSSVEVRASFSEDQLDFIVQALAAMT